MPSLHAMGDLSDLNAYFVVGAAVSVPIMSGSFIFVYNLFKSLNVRKVMIYLYTWRTWGACQHWSDGRNLSKYGSDAIYFSAPSSLWWSVLLMKLLHKKTRPLVLIVSKVDLENCVKESD